MMDTTLRKEPLFTAKRLVKVRRVRTNSTEQVASWLENEDTSFAKIFAYTVCLTSGVLIAVRVMQVLIA